MRERERERERREEKSNTYDCYLVSMGDWFEDLKI
jgi:hypothetical protein